jgi:predicted transposase YbfD/YdcC
MDAAVPASRGPVVSVPVARVCGDLLELLGGVSDGRSDQGRDHPVSVVLALAAAAVVAGMKGYTAITGWVRDVPAGVLADLYVRAGGWPVGPPSKTTIWRVVTEADAEAVDAAVGHWLMSVAGFIAASGMPAGSGGENAGREGSSALMQVRLDGKTLRGATDAEGNQTHLLAALVGPDAATSVVAAQTEVGAKTNEVPMATTVLDHIDLTNKIVTADALHTVKATAEHIHQRGGHFVLPVKENRQALFNALDALPWEHTPIAHRSTDKGHGRITTRTIQVLPAPPDLPFPHVNQVFLIERYVHDRHGRPISAVAALGVASPTPDQTSPQDLAGYVRQHWSIESLHWIRDTLYQEDTSHTRTRSGPRIMATLRNLAISALRLAGRTDITEATRWASRYMTRPFTILGLTT